jgi:hypothetical protein
VFVVVVLVISGVQGVRVQTVQVHNRFSVYGFSIAMEFFLLGYVWLLGLRPRGKTLRDLIGGRWAGPKDVLRDIGVAMLFWLVVAGALIVLHAALGDNPDSSRALKLLSPHTPVEMVVWVMTSVSAGFCEESFVPRILAATVSGVYRKRRNRDRFAGSRLRSWPPLSGMERRGDDNSLWRTFRHAGDETQKPAPRNDSARRTGFDHGTAGELFDQARKHITNRLRSATIGVKTSTGEDEPCVFQRQRTLLAAEFWRRSAQ